MFGCSGPKRKIMDHDASFFLTNLAMVLGVAAVTTVLFHVLRQPVVLGYLLAGLIIGPHIPIPIVADQQTVHTLSELGVILLMFSLGLEFSLTKLVRVAPTAGIIALVQCSFMLWLGYLTGSVLGWTQLESLYTGAIVAISSTTIIVKAFAEEKISGATRELVLGILIVEDLVAIVLLAVLTAVSSGAGLSAAKLAWTVFSLAAFLIALVVIGLLVVPPLFRFIARLERDEMTVVAAVGFCFAIALLAERFGYSVALGAFVAGALVAESGVQMRIELLVGPIRDMFAAVFFVAVGMLIDPLLVIEHWPAVLALTLVVVVGKVASVALAAFFTGFGVRTSIQAGMSLAQIGEFSFIIAAVGVALGSTRTFLYPVAIAVSAITTLVTPFLIRHADAAASYVDRHLPRPLQSFAALYGTWLEELRVGARSPLPLHSIRRMAIWLVVDATCLGAIIIGAALSLERLSGLVQERTEFTLTVARALAIGCGVLASLPFCIGIAHITRALGELLASRAMPPAESGKLDLGAAPRRAFVFALQCGLLLVVVAPVVAVAQPFLPSAEGAIFIVTILTMLAVGFWRTASNLQGHVRAGSQMVAELLAKQASAPAETAYESLAMLEKALPGFGAPLAVRLIDSSPAVGKNLVQLNLRGKTGATVIAIARDESGFLPTGKEVLRAGDILALAGTREATSAACALLLPSSAISHS
jgi:CPA2 family monovalent cation:H+ antiporter-2